MKDWKELPNGSLLYVGSYDCHECGWVDSDFSFFYEGDDGWLYCSLHKKGNQQ